ncbi:hypothetical protein BGZ89_003842 [Linnemannia elongata]|nr:hypothetical protein BGZ89_003842 [Linnemannia elongata]
MPDTATMGKKGSNKKSTNTSASNNNNNNNSNNNMRSKKVKLMVKNPFTEMVNSDYTKEQQHDNSTTIVATAPLTASEFAASQQQQQQQQRRPNNYNPFSVICANPFDRHSSAEENDEEDEEDEDEDEESVVRARRETLAALDPYNANAHREHFKSLKVPKQQEDALEQAGLTSMSSSPLAEISTQAKDFEEPEGSVATVTASTPPTSRSQQQQRDSFQSSIYSTPKAQIQQRPISLSRNMTHTTSNNNAQKDIVPEISISLATPSPPPSTSSSKRHHRRGSSLVNANPALLTTTFTPSPLSSISSPLDEEFDRLEANKKKDKTNRSTAIYTNLFQRITSFGSLGGRATEDEVVDHIGAEIKKDPTAPASKPVSTSWSLKRNTFGTSSGTDSSSSLSGSSPHQSSQASRFSIIGKRSNKATRGAKKSRKHGVAAVMDSLDPWDSCDDMLLQGTDDEDDGSGLSATQGDQFLKGRMGGRRRSSDDATTRVETEQGVIPRLGKGAMAGMEDWMMHPRTAAIRVGGSFHKVRHDDAVPVPVHAPVPSSARPVSSSAVEYTTISLASPPMTVYSTQALGSGSNGATTLNVAGSSDSSFFRLKKGASTFLGSLSSNSNSLQNDAKGQAKKSQDQDEDERMRRMMNGDHYDGGGGQDLVFDNRGDTDGDYILGHGRADHRSSSMTFGPTRKAVSPPPLATFSSFPSLRDFIHSATGLSRSSTVPVGSGSGMGNISPPPFSPTAYLRRSQTTTGGFGGYSEVQQGYTSSSSAATTGIDGGRASFSPVSRRKNTPVMVPTIVVPKHVPSSGASLALSATPVDDDDSSDYLSMTMSKTTTPTRTFHRLGLPSSSTPSSVAVPVKAATAANSTQLPSSLAAAAMAAAQPARAAYSHAPTSTSSTSNLNRSNTTIFVDSMTGPLTSNDYIGQFERDRAQARSFLGYDGQGPFGSMHYRINNNNNSSLSSLNSNKSSSVNSLATTVNQQHHQQQFLHGSGVYHPTAMSSTTTLLVDTDDDHARHPGHSAAGVGVGGGDIEKPANRGGAFGFGFLHRPSSSSSSSMSPPRRTRQSSTQSSISEKLMHLPDPSPFEGMCSCRGLVNITSMFLILCGLILLILGYPIASSLKKDRLAAEAAAEEAASAANAALSQVRFAIGTQQQQHPQGGVGIAGLVGPMSKTATSTVVKAAMRGMVDEDTPQDKRTTVAKDGELWDLVFSDEFNLDGRSFAPGQDPNWEAVNLPPSTAMGTLEHYSSDQVTTKNGQLEITLQRDLVHPTPSPSAGAKFQKRDGSSSAWRYTSGMLQSWNKMCFQGGILEVAVSLPGSPTKAGLKPRVFVLGNLARYGYPASMDGVYPFSSSTQCNPTSTNSTVQRLNGCSSTTDAILGLKSRGAPEMTLLETHYGVKMNPEALEAQKRAIQVLQQTPPRVLQRREYHRIKKRQQLQQQQQQEDGEGQGVGQGETVMVLEKQRLGGSRVTVDAAAFGSGRVAGGGGRSSSSSGNGAPRQSIAISSVKLASSSPSSSLTTNGSNITSTVVVETSTPQWIQPIDSRFFSSSSVETTTTSSQDRVDEFIKVGLEYWPGDATTFNTTSSSSTPLTSGSGDEDAYLQFSLNSIRHPPLLSTSHSLLHLHQSPSSSSYSKDDAWYKDAKTLPPTTTIPQEPMSIVLSLGLLQEELLLDPELQFPAVMKVDYIRLYQPRQVEGNGKSKGEWLSCDPIDHPTAEYIRAHPRAYSDPGVRTWAEVGYTA